MKVWVYPADQWGCGSYRLIWPGQAVAAGRLLDVEVAPVGSRSIKFHLGPGGRLLKEEFPAQAGDVVVVQRPTSRIVAEAVPMLRARGVAVVVDMDDDLSCIHPANPAAQALAPMVRHPGPGPRKGQMVKNLHSHHNATAACRAASLVTVTTPALAKRYGAHGRVAVLPNMVPARMLHVEHHDSRVVGWGGSVHSHPDDLQRVGGAVQQLVREGATFVTVGDKSDVARVLGLSEEPGGPGPVALLQWPEAIAMFGVGIAPLADTRFNTAKSWLKPLEYAAVGVPVVCSPTPEYERLAAKTGAVIASRPREWQSALRRLLADGGRRREMSEAGRAVAREHTIEGHAWRWAEAWQRAADAEQAHGREPAGAR